MMDEGKYGCIRLMLSLRPKAPFDFGQSLAFLRGFPLMREDQTITDDAVTRAVAVAGETVVFRAVGKGTVDESATRRDLVCRTADF